MEGCALPHLRSQAQFAQSLLLVASSFERKHDILKSICRRKPDIEKHNVQQALQQDVTLPAVEAYPALSWRGVPGRGLEARPAHPRAVPRHIHAPTRVVELPERYAEAFLPGQSPSQCLSLLDTAVILASYRKTCLPKIQR